MVEYSSAIQEDSSIQEDYVIAQMEWDQEESKRVHIAKFNWENWVN